MTAKGQPVSRTSAGAWCRPNEQYGADAHNAVELNMYEVIAIVGDDLPPNDQKWPKGAVIPGYFKVGNQIVKSLDSTSGSKRQP